MLNVHSQLGQYVVQDIGLAVMMMGSVGWIDGKVSIVDVDCGGQ